MEENDNTDTKSNCWLEQDSNFTENDQSDPEKTPKNAKADNIAKHRRVNPSKDNFLYRYEQNGVIIYDSNARMVG